MGIASKNIWSLSFSVVLRRAKSTDVRVKFQMYPNSYVILDKSLISLLLRDLPCNVTFTKKKAQ